MDEYNPEQTNEILMNILAKLEEMSEDKVEDDAYENVLILSYPRDGTKATLAAGVTDLDFTAGTITATTGAVTDMSTSLRKQGKDFMESVSLKSDVNIIVQLDSHDKFAVDADERFQASNMEFSRVRITTSGTTEFSSMFSTSR